MNKFLQSKPVQALSLCGLLVVLGLMQALLFITRTFHCTVFESILCLASVALCIGYGIYSIFQLLT